MKKILSIFLLTILMTSMVSAFDWDNKATYDLSKKEYTIENMFGLGGKIALIKLNSPQNNVLPVGYQKVAELTITNEKDYNEIIKGIELYNINDGMKEFQRDVDYKYWDGKNWIDFGKNELKKDEVVKVGIFTEVKFGDNVEWIIKMYGERLVEWATWSDSLSDGMVAYWNFDEGTGTLANDSIATPQYYNLSVTGNNWLTDGISNDAYFPNADESANTKLNLSNIGAGANNANATINFWINVTANWTGSDGALIRYGGISANGEFIVDYTSAGDEDEITVATYTNNAKIYRHDIGHNQWNMITLTWNSSDANMYVNGTLVNNTELNGATFQFDPDEFLFLFSSESAANKLDHIIMDEIAVWNRSLNSTDIIDLYDSGTGTFFAGIDTLTLNNPPDNNETSETSIAFNCSASSNDGIQNISLIIDGIINSTEVFDGLIDAEFNLTVNNFSFGSHDWTCNATNNDSEIITATERSFTTGIITNLETFNNSAFETDIEEFIINLSTDGSQTLTANLIYNNTAYSATKTGTSTEVLFSRSINVPILNTATNHSFNWEITAGSDIFNISTNNGQLDNITQFVLCNSTFPTPYINFTFKNETLTEDDINATITSTFIYTLGSTSLNKTVSYINATENAGYDFCFSPNDRGIDIDIEIDYNNAESQQRTFQTLLNLSSSTTEQTLFLLPTSLGQFVTFTVVNSLGQALDEVNTTVYRDENFISQDFTDDTGSVTFFLNPDIKYSFNFSKQGFTTVNTDITPTLTAYEINLGGGEISVNVTTDFLKGIFYSFQPKTKTLLNQTTYSFNFTTSSSFWTIESFGFVLNNGTSTIGSTSSSANGGTVNLNVNTALNETIIMDAFWVITGNYTNVTTQWTIRTSGDTGFSILNFFDDLKLYLDQGIFGIDNFGMAIITFLFIFVFTGIMSFKFGLRSPQTLLGIVFALVLFLDVGIGLFDNLPTPVSAIPHFPTIFMLIIIIGVFLREVNR